MVTPFLEQMTLQKALNKKRIFVVDLTFLDEVTVDHPDKFKVGLNIQHTLDISRSFFYK